MKKAEKLLDCIPDELEKAEFYYKVGAFHYDIYQGLLSYKKSIRGKKKSLLNMLGMRSM